MKKFNPNINKITYTSFKKICHSYKERIELNCKY